VLYVGNLDPSTTTEKIKKFISLRAANVMISAPKVYKCGILEKGDSAEACGAHLVVNAESADNLRVRSFWPGRVYARPWIFKDRAAMAENLDQQLGPASSE